MATFCCQSTVGASDWNHAALSLPRWHDVLGPRLINRTFSSALDRGTHTLLKGKSIVAKLFNVWETLSLTHIIHVSYMFPAFGWFFTIHVGMIYHTWIVWASYIFPVLLTHLLQILVGWTQAYSKQRLARFTPFRFAGDGPSRRTARGYQVDFFLGFWHQFS